MENRDIINKTVELVLNNEKFEEKFKNYIDKIFDDNKINGEDMPILLKVFILMYNEYNELKLNDNIIKDVLLLVLYRYLDKYKDIYHIDIKTCMKLIEPQMDLLLMNINLNKSCSKNFNCCISRPNKNEKDIWKLDNVDIEELKKKRIINKENLLPEKIDLNLEPDENNLINSKSNSEDLDIEHGIHGSNDSNDSENTL